MNNNYPIPKITTDINSAVQQEFNDKTEHSFTIMERIRGNDQHKGENEDIAEIIDTFSKKSNDPKLVLFCGAVVYRFIEKAYQLKKQQIPRVTKKTYKDVLLELNEPVERMHMVIKRLEKYNPFIQNFIANLSIMSGDGGLVTYTGLITYNLIEKQIKNNLEKELAETIVKEDYKRAAILRDQIKTI